MFVYRFETMPHGDFSDFAALGLFGCGAQLVFKPTLGLGPINAIVTASSSAETVAAFRIFGAVLMITGITLFQVRWNTVHKLVALAFVMSGAFAAYLGNNLAGGFNVTANPFFLYGLLFVASGFHIAFRSNKTYKQLGWIPPADKKS